jgi:CDP-diacylglycerol--serine O-phosphatidyltransferase
MVKSKKTKNLLKGFKNFELHKALFILPNAFTLGSIFCGSYAILNTINDASPQGLYTSCMAVFFAGIFDMFDGRVARLTKTQSDFGVEFDSLADVISFGVAPSVIVYRWALLPLGNMGMFFATIFAACGAIRLARFNVLARREDTDSNFFMGLPIPIAASMLIALVAAHFHLHEGSAVKSHILVILLMVLLSWLMVSNVLFWTFKNIKFGRKSIYGLFIFAIFLFLMGKRYHISIIFVSLISTYITAGLTRQLFKSLKKKHN